MASGATIGARTIALVDQGELKRALKLLERERREALKRGDIASVEDVFAAAKVVYARADGKGQSEAGRIAFAAQQNIRQLGRQAALAAGEDWVDPFADKTRKPRPVDKGGHGLFGDPRRPRSLAVAAIAGIATFPVWWFAAMVAWGFGGDNSDGVASPRPADGGRHSVHVIVVVAAALAAVSFLATTIHAARARRRVPSSERARLTRNEGFVYAAAVLVVLGAAIGLFLFLWIATPLRSEFAPYTSP